MVSQCPSDVLRVSGIIQDNDEGLDYIQAVAERVSSYVRARINFPRSNSGSPPSEKKFRYPLCYLPIESLKVTITLCWLLMSAAHQKEVQLVVPLDYLPVGVCRDVSNRTLSLATCL